ncbi:hypothetical protein [Viscerimonas tarda]
MEKGILSCREIRYREFPGMLFGLSGKGMLYFDAGRYLREKGNTQIHSIENFRSQFGFWIRAVQEAFDLREEDLLVRDEAADNWYMEESLSLLFAAYLDPGFAVHLLERMSEMLLTGMALSDTALLRIAGERITKEDLT